jgi:predicted  nucleic acid-binding Zn-ribbon protein
MKIPNEEEMNECRACGAAFDGVGELCGHCCPSCGFEPSKQHNGMCCACFTEMHYEREALLEARWKKLRADLEAEAKPSKTSDDPNVDPDLKYALSLSMNGYLHGIGAALDMLNELEGK